MVITEENLEEKLRVTFDREEMNGFYRSFLPLDLETVWAEIDGESEESVERPR